MTATIPKVQGTLAPLKNVSLFRELMETVVNRAPHLPGMACFYGFSGLGKTISSTYAANRARAYYVEVGESWTRRNLCDAILQEVGVTSNGSVADRVAEIIFALGEEPDRPLIIDEADFLVRRRMIDVAREIHDKSTAPVILIGEELLPAKLMKWERAHNRMLDWVAAQPCDMEDTRHLAALYAPQVQIADELLGLLLRASGGRVRRICVNIERIRQTAMLQGCSVMTPDEWQESQFFTGEPPKRRRR